MFTLAGAVTVSAVIALTLSPMMCSRLLRPHRAEETGWESRLVRFIDARFESLRGRYQRRLDRSLDYTPVTAIFVVLVLVSIALLYRSAHSELAPQEDQGFVRAQPTSAAERDAATEAPLRRIEEYKVIQAEHAIQNVFQVAAPGQPFDGLVLVPITQRDGATQCRSALQQHMNSVAGEKIVVFELPSLPGASGLPVQFVIKTTEPSVRLNEVSRAFLDEVNASGRFLFFDTDLKYDLPQSVIEIDREKTAQLGLNMSQVGSSLGSLLGGGYVNYFSMQQRSYRVIPQVQRVSRLNVEQLLDYPIANFGGVPVPLSTIARIRTRNHSRDAESLSAVEFGDAFGRRIARLVGGRDPRLSAQRGGAHAALRLYHRLRRPLRASSSRNRAASSERSASPSSSCFSRWPRFSRAFAIPWSS